MTISTEFISEARFRLNSILAITKINAPVTKFTLPKTAFRVPGGNQSARVQIGSEGGVPVFVNGYLVAQGTMRDMVLYWYQSHGRIVASEYWAKFLLIADGLKNRPTDGAMVRIWTTAADGEETAQARAVEFAQRVYPQVDEFLPK
jgi:EpsI family protein